jgi:hypothetical protein
MTIDPNFTIKVTSTPKVQMKHWGFGQQSINNNTLYHPKHPQVTQSVLESRQKSIEPTPSENSQNNGISTYFTTTIPHYTTKTYYKLTKSRR